MPRIIRFFLFLSLSLLCFIAVGILLLGEMRQYNTERSIFPPAAQIGGVPVGGLDAQAASERLEQAYSETPVELRIDSSAVHIDPATAGQRFDSSGIVQSALDSLSERPYWQGLWDFLWQRPPESLEAENACAVDREALHAYLLQEIAPRYQQPPVAGGPVAAGDVLFRSGQPGTVLDLEQAEPEIQRALCALEARVVTVTTRITEEPERRVDDLKPLLQTIVQASGFDGLVEIYFQDLKSGQEINFAALGGQAVEPGIAFTAASTIKIPVMVSTYKQVDAMPESLRRQMELMIDLSDNSSTDTVMEQALDPNIAPVQVTQDMQALSLKNTFLAGFFYPGAPLLNLYDTPANRRTDISTDPDVYNQTTAADMGRLLAAIHRCAVDGSGPLMDAFGGSVNQAECQEMSSLLEKNRKGVLIENGLPEGVRMGHKYGWVTDPNDGLMRNASDAALVFSPGGDFILSLYMYHPNQLHWDPAQRLAARLTTALYNFYNN